MLPTGLLPRVPTRFVGGLASLTPNSRPEPAQAAPQRDPGRPHHHGGREIGVGDRHGSCPRETHVLTEQFRCLKTDPVGGVEGLDADSAGPVCRVSGTLHPPRVRCVPTVSTPAGI